MKRYSLSAPLFDVEVSDLNLMGLIYECNALTPEQLDAITDLHPNNSVTFNGGTGAEFTILRTE